MTVSIKRHLFGQNIFPTMLNSRSTDLEDAGTHKYGLANLLIAGGYKTCDLNDYDLMND